MGEFDFYIPIPEIPPNVVPAKAGTQVFLLDSRLRGNDSGLHGNDADEK